MFTGLTNITVYTGQHPNLEEGVQAVDARFGNMGFTIDDSAVSYNMPGTYTITYTSQDPAGNVATATRSITILKQPERTLGDYINQILNLIGLKHKKNY